MKNSKTAKVLLYLQNHKEGITPMDALRLFNVFRLSSIIFNLKKYGYEIESELEYNENGTRYARYYMEVAS